MSEHEKKQESLICLTLKQAKVSLSIIYKAEKNILEKKSFLRKRGSGRLNEKGKKRLFNCSHNGD